MFFIKLLEKGLEHLQYKDRKNLFACGFLKLLKTLTIFDLYFDLTKEVWKRWHYYAELKEDEIISNTHSINELKFEEIKRINPKTTRLSIFSNVMEKNIHNLY